MRQAGRALPIYRKLREKTPLHTLFHTPRYIEEVTRMPLDALGVDAAILFSDILIPLEELGFALHYPEGKAPFVTKGKAAVPHFVYDAIAQMKPTLPVPLIGFAGGPYTVGTYVEKEPSRELLEEITEITITYLKKQIAAGVDALQIFDSWAGMLEPSQFDEKALPYLKKITRALEGEKVPLILFTKRAPLHVDSLVALKAQGISVDDSLPLSEVKTLVPQEMAIQGNLNPERLLGSQEEMIDEVERILETMKEEKRFIFNLGHGVLPTTPFDSLQALVKRVKSYESI